jgi:hypothetical protein
MVHYLVFDTETDLPAPYHGADVPGGAEGMDETNVGSYSNAQVDFIKQDLASVDRSKTARGTWPPRRLICGATVRLFLSHFSQRAM